MITWLANNIGTITAIIIIAAIIAAALISTIRRRKKGGCNCGCGCENCSGNCHIEKT